MFIVWNSDKSSFKFHVLQFKLFLSGQIVFINVIIKFVMHVDVRLFEHYITRVRIYSPEKITIKILVFQDNGIFI